jgi:transporter family protein
MPKWLIFTLLTVLLWGLWGVLSKMAAMYLSAWQLQAISTVGMVPVIGALAWRIRARDKTQRAPGRRGVVLAFVAGLLGGVGNAAFFQALLMGGKAAAVVPVTALYPITTIVLATVFLSERLNVVQSVGIVLSLMAIFLFNVADVADLLTAWLAYSLVPIVLWGVGGYLQKLATLRISSDLCTLAFLLGFLPLSIAVLVVDPNITGLSAETFWQSVLVGLFFALGNFTVILAYGSGGKAAIVTSLAALYPLVTIPLAVVLLGERLSLREALAIATALIAVLALSYERPQESIVAPSS